ncbi:MAG: hypothetical protein MUC49_19430 [Raineya sp.]|jgi:hypothetical protein|nr:hypothetical protein [Raineya sp.]
MKYLFIIFLLFCSWVQVIAQDRLVIIQDSYGIVIKDSKGKEIQPIKSVSFKKRKNNFVAKKYISYGETGKFTKTQTIPAILLEDFLKSKYPISLKTLGISVQELKESIDKQKSNILISTQNLLTEDYIFKFDTLKFCTNNRFSRYFSSCSGRKLDILYNNTSIFSYSTDYEFTLRNLESYLRAYIFLKNIKLEEQIYVFNKDIIVNWLILYLENIQCEDYYASLFMKENPEYNNSVFKRTKKGWNFEKYLKKVKGSKN